MNLAEVTGQGNRHGEPSVEANTAITADPTMATVRRDGMRFFQQKAHSSALACFDQWLCVHPDDRDVLNYKARTLEALGRCAESLNCIDRCLELAPNDLAELCNRALLLTKLSRRADALTALDHALTRHPHQIDVLIKRVLASPA